MGFEETSAHRALWNMRSSSGSFVTITEYFPSLAACFSTIGASSKCVLVLLSARIPDDLKCRK